METCMVWACHTPWQHLQTILQGTLGGGWHRARQRKCWIDNINDWKSLPMLELLTMASCRKDWKKISVESSLMYPRRPSRSRDWTELNWTDILVVNERTLSLFPRIRLQSTIFSFCCYAMPLGQTWLPLFGLFPRNSICEVLIGWAARMIGSPELCITSIWSTFTVNLGHSTSQSGPTVLARQTTGSYATNTAFACSFLLVSFFFFFFESPIDCF